MGNKGGDIRYRDGDTEEDRVAEVQETTDFRDLGCFYIEKRGMR